MHYLFAAPLFRSEPLSHQHLHGRRFGDAGAHECREIPIERSSLAHPQSETFRLNAFLNMMENDAEILFSIGPLNPLPYLETNEKGEGSEMGRKVEMITKEQQHNNTPRSLSERQQSAQQKG
ncbi:hypothetical protein CDAR_448901 [Caerostris darwini]|uniref:Uncharacterized protein n=1 Tax=Caerostris darwini TaxID=1538125 RepID=A0AAV4WA74_9ARAC|nr:hypothetical protein CDAR_448901 [Caerostris darwini]